MKQSIVFFGNERIATGLETNTPILRSLIEAGYHIEAIIVSNREAKSRKKRELEVELFARERQIPFLAPSGSKELHRICEKMASDTAILAAYGRMVPQRVIDCFKHGIINIHPSLLPKHRGSTPIESAILHGDDQTGVSIMQLVLEMDAGPVFTQKRIKLRGNETKKELAQDLIQLGITALLDALPDIISGEAVAQEQDESEATYDDKIEKEGGKIDWSKPAIAIEREVRAYAGWPRSRTKLGSIDAVVTKVHVLQLEKTRTPGALVVQDGCLAVACGDGSYLCIERLIPAGKKEMPIDAFLRGYASRINTIFDT